MEGVILALCLFAALDLCSVHSLSLPLKYPFLAPSQQMDVKPAVGQAVSLVLVCLLFFTHSLMLFVHLEA